MAPRISQSKKRRGRAASPSRGAGEPAAATDLRPIAPLVERIVARLTPEEIWLFGSRAEGRARPDGDYDLLAVLSDDAPESALDLIKAWELTTSSPASIITLTSWSPSSLRTSLGKPDWHRCTGIRLTRPRTAMRRPAAAFRRLPMPAVSQPMPRISPP
jgi:hypothetical protein